MIFVYQNQINEINCRNRTKSLGNDKLAITIVKSCANLNLDGVTLQIQPNEYYDGKNYKKN